MKIKTASVEIDPKSLTFDLVRQLTDEFLKSNPKEGKKYWDCMAALRGPDVGLPDEKGVVMVALANGNSPGPEHARVQRKATTTAILRARMFPGAAGCSAAQMNNDPNAIIFLPPKDAWDHFDKHVFKAAQWLDLPMQIGDEAPPQPLSLGDDIPLLVPKSGYSPCKMTIPDYDLHDPDMKALDYLQPGAVWQLVKLVAIGSPRVIMRHKPGNHQLIMRYYGDWVQVEWYQVAGLHDGYIYLQPMLAKKPLSKVEGTSLKGLGGKVESFPPNLWGIKQGYLHSDVTPGEWDMMVGVLKKVGGKYGAVSADGTMLIFSDSNGADYYHLYCKPSAAEQEKAKLEKAKLEQIWGSTPMPNPSNGLAWTANTTAKEDGN